MTLEGRKPSGQRSSRARALCSRVKRTTLNVCKTSFNACMITDMLGRIPPDCPGNFPPHNISSWTAGLWFGNRSELHIAVVGFLTAVLHWSRMTTHFSKHVYSGCNVI